MRRSAALLLACLAVVAATAAAAPAPAPAARGMEVAVQDDGAILQQLYYDRHKALRRAARLGATRLRVNVLWSRVVERPRARRPPREPRYHWQVFDDLVADAARHGIRLQMTLTGPAPRWATRDRRVGIVRPDPRRFAAFAADAAEHFAGRVDRYAIWNEPNWHTWLTPGRGCRHGRWGAGCDRRLASLYRSLYRLAYDAIDRADPAAEVLFGELAPQGRPGAATPPLTLLRDVTCSRPDWRAAKRCAPLEADGLAHHPYSFTSAPTVPYGGPGDVTIGTLDRLAHALDRLAARRALRTPAGAPLDLFLTEFGYFAAGRRGLPAATRAAWLQESFDLALRHPRVRQLLQYLLVAPPASRDTFPTHILDRRGRTTAPYRALADWAERNRRRLAARTD